MMIHGFAAYAAKEELRPFQYEVKELGPYEVEVAVTHCGLCHSDIHLIDDDWKKSVYPLVAGHEIVGTVARKGKEVKLEIGQRVGVGYQLSACLSCYLCKEGDENLCARRTDTCVRHQGGFADKMIADGRFAYPIPESLSSEFAAPLMCAGVTVYAPMKRYLSTKKRTVGIIGVGGLGHLALQFARALGHEVIAISHSMEKKEEALHFGATSVIDSSDPKNLQNATSTCDFLLNTGTGDADWNIFLTMLKPKGTLCFVGRPTRDPTIAAMLLTSGQKQISGSTVGSRAVMEEMLQFAGANKIAPLIESFPMKEINQAIAKLRKGKIRYRAVLNN